LTGKVYLVGAGPGALDLLTLRAARLLAEADCVFHDALIHPDMLALAPHARLVSVGKRSGGPSTAQQVIDQQLVDSARHYQRIVRLKGGDPMLFGRAQEEIDALTAAGIEFEVVPGVTAASGAAAELQCPLTRRKVGRTLLLATPRVAKGAPDSEWVRAVLASDSAALYMAGDGLAWVAEQLMAGGADPETPTVVIEDATLPTQRSDAQTLADLRACPPRGHGGPRLLLIGSAVADVPRPARAPGPSLSPAS